MEEDFDLLQGFDLPDYHNPESLVPDIKELSKYYKSTGKTRKINYKAANNIKPIYQGKPITTDLILKIASPYFGTGYKLGGKKLGKPIDCSGWTRALYQHFGVDIGEGTDFQMQGGWQKVNEKSMREGDVIFYKAVNGIKHTGIVIKDPKTGKLKMIDSSTADSPQGQGIGIRDINYKRGILGVYRPYIPGYERGGKLIRNMGIFSKPIIFAKTGTKATNAARNAAKKTKKVIQDVTNPAFFQNYGIKPQKFIDMFNALRQRGLSNQVSFEATWQALKEQPTKFYAFGKSEPNLEAWANHVYKTLTTSSTYKSAQYAKNFDQYRQATFPYNKDPGYTNWLKEGREAGRTFINWHITKNGLGEPVAMQDDYQQDIPEDSYTYDLQYARKGLKLVPRRKKFNY